MILFTLPAEDAEPRVQVAIMLAIFCCSQLTKNQSHNAPYWTPSPPPSTVRLVTCAAYPQTNTPTPDLKHTRTRLKTSLGGHHGLVKSKSSAFLALHTHFQGDLGHPPSQTRPGHFRVTSVLEEVLSGLHPTPQDIISLSILC